MKEFALLFRMNITNKALQPSKEQMDIYMTQWMSWINEIADKDQLADGGNHFSRQGRTLHSGNKVMEGPHVANDHAVAGYIIVLADSIDQATEIAAKCPILNGENTSVEVREIASPGS